MLAEIARLTACKVARVMITIAAAAEAAADAARCC